MNLKRYKLAKAAYAAYGAVTDNKNFRGEPMPLFDELTTKIQLAWQAAVGEVVNQLTTQITTWMPGEDE